MPKHKLCTPLTAKRCKLTLHRALSKLNAEELKEIVSHFSNDGIYSVCEILYNLLYGALPMQNRLKKKLLNTLQGQEGDFKQLTQWKTPPKKRRKKLVKQGGKALGKLLSLTIPILEQIVDKHQNYAEKK